MLQSLRWFFLTVTAYTAPLQPCTGPIDLLGELLRGNITADYVEIVQSGCHKGYRLGEHSITRVESDDIMTPCSSLPAEFSIQLGFKRTSPQNCREYLLTLLAQDQRTMLLSVRYGKDSIIFDYIRKDNHRLDSVKFSDESLSNGRWHNVILSVINNEVKMKLDCSAEYVKVLDHALDLKLNMKKTKIFIGSRNRKRRRFTGLFRQIKLALGDDISENECFESTPIVDVSHDLIDNPVFQSSHQTPIHASNQEMLSYGCNMSPPNKCEENVVTVCRMSKLDYVIDFGDIRTSSGAIDFEAFHIEGYGYFLATANSGDSPRSNSSLLLWNGKKFQSVQQFSSKHAQHWKYFRIGEDHFLALANSKRTRNHDVKSPIFRWNFRKKKFVRIQLLSTHSARSWEAFEIDGNHFLAVANHMDDKNNTKNLSEVYKWHKDARLFQPYQNLLTTGATDVEFFRIRFREKIYHMLAVANTFDGKSTKLNSSIFYWSSGKFLLLQNIETTGASDIESFQIEGSYFLAIANTLDLNGSKRNYRLKSIIYKLDLYSRRFEKFQEIETNGARDWEYFTIGSSSFLIASNLFSSKENSVQILIYRWKGVEKFIPVHNFTSKPTTDIEHINIGSDHYLAMADPDWEFSKLYKLVMF